MSLSQASTSAPLKRSPLAPRKALRRDGDEDLWSKLDAKLAEREVQHCLAKPSPQARSAGWVRQIMRGIGFGLR